MNKSYQHDKSVHTETALEVKEKSIDKDEYVEA